MSRVLVTGATGNIGAHAVRELRSRSVPVRAFTRDTRTAAGKLGADVDIAVGDFADARSVQQALEGIELVVLSSSNHPAQAEHEAAVIEASMQAGVQRIVKLSTVSAEIGSKCAFFDAHARAEQHLRAAGIPAVILQSGFYMSNLFGAARAIQTMGRLFAPLQETRISMIDPRDVAAVAVTALLTDRYEGQTLVLTGPEAITYERVAAELSSATGRDVQFIPVPDDAARQNMLDSGIPDWFVQQILALFALLRDGVATQVTDTVRAVTGKEPWPFADFAREYAAAFTTLAAPQVPVS